MPFDVVLADPCWAYRNVRTGGSHTSGAAQKYETMSVADIWAMPVQSILAKNAVCFLWATVPLGQDPYRVLDAWGFEFKTEWFWHKTGRKGTGYWTRGCVEKVLVGVRGTVKAWRSNVDNWFEESADPVIVSATPEQHSRKPAAMREVMEMLTPGLRRVELFSTQPEVPGWTHYGLAIDPAHDFRAAEFWRRAAHGEGHSIPAAAADDGGGSPTLADA